METLRSPKVCAVCGVTLDEWVRAGKPNEWVHTQELVGQGDHVAIPIDYDESNMKALCDFCYAEIPLPRRQVVPADNFDMPHDAGRSIGNWTACPECATLISRRRWTQLVNRATDGFFKSQYQVGMTRSMVRRHIGDMYERLQVHVTGPVRPWAPGDELAARE